MSDALAPLALTADVDPRLLEILVCPVTHGPLVYDREAGELISQGAKLAYPIRDGVPIMLPEEARTID
ncbi:MULTISPECIES: Trm112 family protein [unclassified Phenylobacterium]|uniref:Trm112 family protein n=1 Tax=unclassified Phenylobacterium TaxID=2640670 RepID=UPI0022B4D07C|nr:Trm112 family protein [Phenylobacterium sp. NIBR 498073]MBS0489606.1 Trm112 family protein [Pseudomonadota bacterium]WGU40172.1 Trm112 family protein [Phenylobacterium sp. NIBR 498073]